MQRSELTETQRQEIVEHLSGTCLEDHQVAGEYDLEDEDINAIMEDAGWWKCVDCGWWCEGTEMHDRDGEMICNDCEDDSEGED